MKKIRRQKKKKSKSEQHPTSSKPVLYENDPTISFVARIIHGFDTSEEYGRFHRDLCIIRPDTDTFLTTYIEGNTKVILTARNEAAKIILNSFQSGFLKNQGWTEKFTIEHSL